MQSAVFFSTLMVVTGVSVVTYTVDPNAFDDTKEIFGTVEVTPVVIAAGYTCTTYAFVINDVFEIFECALVVINTLKRISIVVVQTMEESKIECEYCHLLLNF